MKKIVLIISLFFVLIFSFSCKEKKSQTSLLAGYETTVGDLDSVELSDEVKTKIADIGLKQGMNVTILKNDWDNMTVKVKELKKKIVLPSDALNFDFHAIELLVPALMNDEQFAQNIFIEFKRSDKKIPNEDSVKLVNEFISYVTEKMSVDLTKDNYVCPGFDDALDILHGCYNYENDITSYYHILAEKTCYKILDKNGAISYDGIEDENGRTPYMRAVLAENYSAALYFYKMHENNQHTDKFEKSVVDYARESKNEDIKNLFSVVDIDFEKLSSKYISQLKTKKLIEAFSLIGKKYSIVPYTLWKNENSAAEDEAQNASDYNFAFLCKAKRQPENSETISSDNEAAETEASENEAEAGNSVSETDNGISSDENKEDENQTPDSFLIYNSPDEITGKESAILPYGTLVKVLDRTEETNIFGTYAGVLGYTEDYIYKISYEVNGKTFEGWIPGTVLGVPVKNFDEKDIQKKYESLVQDDFRIGYNAIVVAEDNVLLENGETYKIEPTENIEILYEVTKGDSELNEIVNNCLNYVGENKDDNDLSEGVNYTYYPYYIVRKIGSKPGLLSGKSLAHKKIREIENTVFYISYKKEMDPVNWYGDIFEYTDSKMRKYDFVKPEGIGVTPQDFRLGPIVSSYSHPEVEVTAPTRPFVFNGETEDGPKKMKERIRVFTTRTVCEEFSQCQGYRDFRRISFVCLNDYFAINVLSNEAECYFYFPFEYADSSYEVLDGWLDWDDNNKEIPPVACTAFYTKRGRMDGDSETNCHKVFYKFDGNEYYEDHVEDSDEVYEK